MGGHGGLNILPQKSWNVYGRESRLKVARDEAKFAEETKVKRERHLQAEREARRAALLQKARDRQAGSSRNDAALAYNHSNDAALGVAQPVMPPPEAVQTQPTAEPASAVTQAAAVAEPAAAATAVAQLGKQPKESSLLKHINFWLEDELKTAHPEVKAEKKMEQMRRGKADTQTSDAKFDEQFQLGHRMQSKPWYASVALEPVVDGNSIADHGQGVALPAGTDMVVLDSDLKRLKHEHKHKSKKGHKSKKSGKSDAKSVAELRAERQAREQKERQLQRKLLQAHHNVR